MIKTLIPLAALAFTGCASQAAIGDGRTMPTDITCIFEDPANAGASADEICAMFIERVGAANPGKVLAITIKAPSRSEAAVIITDAEGDIVAERQFDVMDAGLNPAIWQDFADATAKAAATR